MRVPKTTLKFQFNFTYLEKSFSIVGPLVAVKWKSRVNGIL
jgi:hypothetical protein